MIPPPRIAPVEFREQPELGFCVERHKRRRLEQEEWLETSPALSTLGTSQIDSTPYEVAAVERGLAFSSRVPF
jgi:hypothetical protein